MLGNRFFAAAVGIALLLVIAYNMKYFMSRNGSSTPPKQAAVTATNNVLNGNKPDAQHDRRVETPEKDRTVAWKRDPFSIKSVPSDRKVLDLDIKLSGIIRGETTYALVNGKIYGLNDRIGDAVITEIRQHSIVVKTDGLKQEIKIDDHNVAKEKKK